MKNTFSDEFHNELHNELSEIGRRTSPPPIAWFMRKALKDPEMISLAAGFTDDEMLPLFATRDVLKRLLDQEMGRRFLQYGSSEGDEKLREQTAKRLSDLDERSEPDWLFGDDILITNGSQQFLYLITEALCDSGDLIIVEDPTYFVYLGILKSRGIFAKGIPMESDGMSLEHLEGMLKMLTKTGEIRRLKMIYIVSYFQNPTGITTSLEKKKAILNLLKRYESEAGHRLYMLEDAAYRELHFPKYQPPFSSLCLNAFRSRIIYTGTYSKPFATGIRVGFGVLPRSIKDAVTNIKGNHDFGTSHLLQGIISSAISDEDYDHQLMKVRETYSIKCKKMMQCLEKSLASQADFTHPKGGLCLWMSLKNDTGPKSKLFADALSEGVLYVPGEFAFADDPTRAKPQSSLRLSFGSASQKDIEEGIRRLTCAICK